MYTILIIAMCWIAMVNEERLWLLGVQCTLWHRGYPGVHWYVHVNYHQYHQLLAAVDNYLRHNYIRKVLLFVQNKYL